MRRPLRALVALLAAACSRDLGMPSKNRLALTPEFTSVPPRGTFTFTASGGAGGYRFEFSPGGQLSGVDAEVGTAGAYRAGSAGSAQDLVRVVDAAGAVAEARVTVTAHLSAAPTEAYVSPG